MKRLTSEVGDATANAVAPEPTRRCSSGVVRSRPLLIHKGSNWGVMASNRRPADVRDERQAQSH